MISISIKRFRVQMASRHAFLSSVRLVATYSFLVLKFVVALIHSCWFYLALRPALLFLSFSVIFPVVFQHLHVSVSCRRCGSLTSLWRPVQGGPYDELVSRIIFSTQNTDEMSLRRAMEFHSMVFLVSGSSISQSGAESFGRP